MIFPLLLLAAAPLDAPVSMPPLEAIEIAPPLALAVRDALAVELSAKGIQTLTPEEQARCTTPCTPGYLLTGSLGKVGDQLVLGVSLVNVKTSEVMARAGESASTLDGIKTRLPDVVLRLLQPHDQVVASIPLPKNPVFVILELKGAGLPDDRARNLVQVVATELRRIEGSRVLSRDEVQAMLGAENLRQVLDASCDRSCFSRLAGALDADYVISGSAGVLEQTYVVSLTAIDQRSDGQARRITETYQGSADELLRATRHAAQSLFGLTQGTGSLSVGATEGGAVVRLDDKELGALPLPPQAELKPGKYAVTLEKGGYQPWRSEIYINPNDTTVLWAELEKKPDQWFEKWWVWTVVGVAVAGGATAIVAAATSGQTDVGTVGVSVR